MSGDVPRAGLLTGPVRLGLRLIGAGLLAATAAIHLDLYVTGYRTIPTIGWLFLLQVIAGFALALAVLVTDSRLLAAAGAGFALTTLLGYLLAVWFGLFGFKEVRTTAGVVAGVIEVAAFAALAVLAAVPTAQAGQPASQEAAATGPLAALQRGLPHAWPVVGATSVVALAVFAISLAEASGPAAVASGGLRTAQVGGVTVLTDAKGLTLYWFAPDTPAKSACYGSCAAYWPPVYGKPSAGPGVVGKLGTIRRTDGKIQATYNGHPLYTYVGDSGPGQAHGNGLNLNGGFWYEVKVTG